MLLFDYDTNDSGAASVIVVVFIAVDHTVFIVTINVVTKNLAAGAILLGNAMFKRTNAAINTNSYHVLDVFAAVVFADALLHYVQHYGRRRGPSGAFLEKSSAAENVWTTIGDAHVSTIVFSFFLFFDLYTVVECSLKFLCFLSS
jgi:hypothetical protein